MSYQWSILDLTYLTHSNLLQDGKNSIMVCLIMLSMNAKNTIKRMKEIKILRQSGVVLLANHQIGFSFFLRKCIYSSVLYIQFKILGYFFTDFSASKKAA